MTKRIYKYPLPPDLQFTLTLPWNSQNLHVAIDNKTGEPALWALVTMDVPDVVRHFVVVATGEDIPPDHFYVASWQSGPYVWHLFQQVTFDDQP